ncbi:oxidoreductase [Gordonia zhaorongruii]|uniref:oxidoreductase n=1 Tax=Gordonia zhaorongruii TaxID=2597659 RepID=UPI0010444E46|nr:oxidoreductase [Gordonia zhaorongruii]
MPTTSHSPEWSLGDAPDQSGKVAVVTGANSGIGFEVARGLASLGATVVMACRNPETAAAAHQRLTDEYPKATVDHLSLDLADRDSIRRCAEQIAERHEAIDIVVANAGFIPKRIAYSADGIELGLATNFLGHFTFIGHLDAQIARAQAARVVTVGSLAHRNKRIDADDLQSTSETRPFRAYARSKLAQLIFAQELNRRLTAAGTAAISVAAHPGSSRTGVMRERNQLVQRAYHSRLTRPLLKFFVQEANAGALPILRAATDESARGGDYFGPSGRFELVGSPARVPSVAQVLDPAVGERLWNSAEHLAGVQFPRTS